MMSEPAPSARSAIVNDSATQAKGLDMLIAIVPENVVKAAADNTILAVMFFALMLGIGLVLTRSESTSTLKRAIEGLFDVSMTLIGLVIKLAPYAVFCLMFNLVAQFGWDLLLRLGTFVLVVLLALAIHQFVVYSAAIALIATTLAAGLLPRRAGSHADGVLHRVQQRHPADRAARGRRQAQAAQARVALRADRRRHRQPERHRAVRGRDRAVPGAVLQHRASASASRSR